MKTCSKCEYEPKVVLKVGDYAESVLGRTAVNGERAAWQCPRCGNWTPYADTFLDGLDIAGDGGLDDPPQHVL